MSRTKQRTAQHITDDAGKALLQAALPTHWVMREYRPDYGLDCSVELFRRSTGGRDSIERFETLGEHIFVQLKSSRVFERAQIEVAYRDNIEKSPERLDPERASTRVDVIPFSLETTELLTVQRMGAGVPVMLVLADTVENQCFFVCLNDYIEKILVPRHEDYTNRKRRVIHVPLANRLLRDHAESPVLAWYGKRAKLYAAFQKFVFQEAELQYAAGSSDFERLARHFAWLIAKYDFWSDTPMWGLIAHYGSKVRKFAETGEPNMLERNPTGIEGFLKASGADRSSLEAHITKLGILTLWKGLAALPRTYEEICREWFLPTAMGLHASHRVR